MNTQEAADILGVNRRRHGDLIEMLRALTLYPWLNTAEDEKRRVAVRWVLRFDPKGELYLWRNLLDDVADNIAPGKVLDPCRCSQGYRGTFGRAGLRQGARVE